MTLDNSPGPQPWWQRGVVYQIYPRSFQDTDGDGVGDLRGVIDRLDYLAHTLGVDAIWLSPFYPSPMADFGYDVADYCAVHPLFGDLPTFDRLVAEAHRRGMKVIIDYVPNHTSDQHPWFQESRASRDNPRRDWYIWRDPRPDGSLPNNWGAVFGGPAWEWDAATGQYYFHHFLKEQPDLNWRNPAVRAAMLDVLRFWLERGVDGFRMDVVGMILKDPELRDNPLLPNPPPGLPVEDLVSRQMPLYNQDLDEVQEIMVEFRRLLDGYGERVAIGEIWYELPRWVRYFGPRGEGLHLPFNFRLMHVPWTAQAVRRSVEELEAILPGFAWPNYVLGNHDQPRLAARVGPQQARVAAMLLLTLRGTPTLYFGDEIGLPNGRITPENVRDPQGIRLGLERSRDVARTPMQWDSTPNAGFTAGTPWLPLSPDWRARTVAAQLAAEDSLLNLYRRLLALRRTLAALTAGRYATEDSGHADVYAYTRAAGTSQALVALNFSAQPVDVRLNQPVTGVLQLSTHLDREEALRQAHTFALRPHEGVIIRVERRGGP